MRKMKIHGSVRNVHGWAITVHGWEYYFLDNKKGDIREAYVCGYENEQGDISMSELSPFIRSITFNDKDLREIAPAIDCEWVD